jgi:hypothetical protein
MGISILAWLSSLDCVSGQYGGLRMITRPIWKCPCFNLKILPGQDHINITHIGRRRRRGPYWPGPIWASIWKWSCSNPITGYFPVVWKYGVYFRVYWSYKHAFHGHFHIGLVIIPRLRLGPIWGSRDDNQANMEMPMY